jgi:CRP/FNR family nitrogen fixation transcriptional regulator
MRPTARVFAKRAHVFIQGEPADCFYKVISGAIFTYRLLNNGRRLINAFYVASDIFGLDACNEHRLSAVTISEATVIAIQRRRLDVILASDAELSQEINSSLIRSLERAQNHTVLLQHNTARERVSAFLFDMAERAPKYDNLELRHADIADYLGLSRETVSRVLAQLAPKRNAIREAGPARVTPGDVEH